MRTATFEKNGSITYPDYITFCFNPNKIKVKTVNNVTVTIGEGGMSYKDSRSAYNNVVEVDISKYLQSFFNTRSILTSTEINIKVETKEDTLNFDILCIWGAMNIGEVFNASHKVIWFRKFPFTFSMYISDNARMYTRYDSIQYVENENLGTGLVRIDPAIIFPDANRFGVVRLDEEIISSVFDYTFDNTFNPVGNGTIINRLVIDDSECGIYLRWIDRHGFYQYYLFQVGDRIQQSQNSGEQLSLGHEGISYSYGVTRYQGKEIQVMIKACAVLVDQDIFKMLLTLNTSPVVDLYIDNDWMPINIQPGTITNTKKPLQDFEITVVLPEIMSQKL